MEIIFDSKRHEELFHKLIKKCKRVRADTISVMYLLALACYDEAQASQMFNFESICICPENFFAGYKIKILNNRIGDDNYVKKSSKSVLRYITHC